MKKNLEGLISEEEFIKKKITAAQKAIADLDSKVKFLAENIQSILNQIDVLNKSSSQNNMNTILQYMTLENSYNKEIQKYYAEKNMEEYNLSQTQSKIKEGSKEIQVLEKRKNNFQTDLIFSPALHQLKNKIAIAQEEIEKLEKKKQSIQNIQIIQPPVTTELPKTKSKIKRNVVLSSGLGTFLMLFLSFFLEYIRKYKSRIKK
jgi:predicted  nucleic acid-binding Zn-ribbon protein